MTSRRDILILLLLTGLALILRLRGIDTDLWLDEIATVVDYMRLPPLEAAATYHGANQHLLNSVLGSISIHVFGETAWAVRLPAMLFGVAAVPLFFRFALEVTERREAILATVFLCLSYHHVWFSQDARGYTAMIFFAVLSTLFLIRCQKRRDGRWSRDWLWFSLSSTLGMLSLLNYAFVVAGQFLVVFAMLSRTRDWGHIRVLVASSLLVVVLTALAYAPTLSSMFEYFSRGAQDMGWQDPLAFARVFLSGLMGALPAMALPAAVVGAIILLAGWLSYMRSEAIVALMLVAPAVANVVALALLNFGAYPRSFLYVMPFGILTLIRGAFVLSVVVRRSLARSRSARVTDYLLPLVLVVGSAVMLPYNYRYPKQDYTGALEYARHQAGPNDVIAAVGYLATGYKVYYAPELAFPDSAEDLDRLRRSTQHVWVLYSFTRDMRRHFGDIQDYIDTELELRRVFPGTLGDGTIYLAVSSTRQ